MTKTELEKKNQQLEAELSRMKKALNSTSFEPTPVTGQFKATYTTPRGSKVSKTVKFKDGHFAVRLKDGTPIPSEGLLKLANGEELTDVEAAAFPDDFGQADAADYLIHLVQIAYGYLEEVK